MSALGQKQTSIYSIWASPSDITSRFLAPRQASGLRVENLDQCGNFWRPGALAPDEHSWCVIELAGKRVQAQKTLLREGRQNDLREDRDSHARGGAADNGVP